MPQHSSEKMDKKPVRLSLPLLLTDSVRKQRRALRGDGPWAEPRNLYLLP